MNVNFGLIPPLAARRHGKAKKEMMSQRALADMSAWAGEWAMPADPDTVRAANTVAVP
jgi:folate-dependent tRNA-U54 methylase TrmFO/GidA